MEAYVTLVATEAYASGALIIAHRLRELQTEKDLVCLVTPNISQHVQTLLAEHYIVQPVRTLRSKDTKNLSILGRPELDITFTKIYAWRLTQYSKIVFLDADTFPLLSIDSLFHRPSFSAAPDAGWPDCFNSGVFVAEPSEAVFGDLLELASQKGSFDGGDQGLLNTYFNTWPESPSNRLPFVFNTTPTAQYGYAPAQAEYGHNVHIAHFIGHNKPWKHQRLSDGSVMPLGNSWEVVQQWWNTWDKHYGKLSPYHLLSADLVFDGSFKTTPIIHFNDVIRNAWENEECNPDDSRKQVKPMPPLSITVNTPNWMETEKPEEKAQPTSQIKPRRCNGEASWPTIDWDPAYEDPPTTGTPGAEIPDLSSYQNVWDQSMDDQVWVAPVFQPEPKIMMKPEYVHHIHEDIPENKDVTFPWESHHLPQPTRIWKDESSTISEQDIATPELENTSLTIEVRNENTNQALFALDEPLSPIAQTRIEGIIAHLNDEEEDEMSERDLIPIYFKSSSRLQYSPSPKTSRRSSTVSSRRNSFTKPDLTDCKSPFSAITPSEGEHGDYFSKDISSYCLSDSLSHKSTLWSPLDALTKLKTKSEDMVLKQSLTDALYRVEGKREFKSVWEKEDEPYFGSGGSSPRTPVLRAMASNLSDTYHQQESLKMAQPQMAFASFFEAQMDLSRDAIVQEESKAMHTSYFNLDIIREAQKRLNELITGDQEYVSDVLPISKNNNNLRESQIKEKLYRFEDMKEIHLPTQAINDTYPSNKNYKDFSDEEWEPIQKGRLVKTPIEETIVAHTQTKQDIAVIQKIIKNESVHSEKKARTSEEEFVVIDDRVEVHIEESYVTEQSEKGHILKSVTESSEKEKKLAFVEAAQVDREHTRQIIENLAESSAMAAGKLFEKQIDQSESSEYTELIIARKNITEETLKDVTTEILQKELQPSKEKGKQKEIDKLEMIKNDMENHQHYNYEKYKSTEQHTIETIEFDSDYHVFAENIEKLQKVIESDDLDNDQIMIETIEIEEDEDCENYSLTYTYDSEIQLEYIELDAEVSQTEALSREVSIDVLDIKSEDLNFDALDLENENLQSEALSRETSIEVLNIESGDELNSGISLETEALSREASIEVLNIESEDLNLDVLSLENENLQPESLSREASIEVLNIESEDALNSGISLETEALSREASIEVLHIESESVNPDSLNSEFNVDIMGNEDESLQTEALSREISIDTIDTESGSLQIESVSSGNSIGNMDTEDENLLTEVLSRGTSLDVIEMENEGLNVESLSSDASLELTDIEDENMHSEILSRESSVDIIDTEYEGGTETPRPGINLSFIGVEEETLRIIAVNREIIEAEEIVRSESVDESYDEVYNDPSYVEELEGSMDTIKGHFRGTLTSHHTTEDEDENIQTESLDREASLDIIDENDYAIKTETMSRDISFDLISTHETSSQYHSESQDITADESINSEQLSRESSLDIIEIEDMNSDDKESEANLEIMEINDIILDAENVSYELDSEDIQEDESKEPEAQKPSLSNSFARFLANTIGPAVARPTIGFQRPSLSSSLLSSSRMVSTSTVTTSVEGVSSSPVSSEENVMSRVRSLGSSMYSVTTTHTSSSSQSRNNDSKSSNSKTS